MQALLMILCVLGITAADQITKALVVEHIPLYAQLGGVDGLFHLTHVHNTGAAFSVFRGHQWLFILIFLVFTGCIVWEFWKRKMPFTTLERWCILCVYAGGLGNVIDRVRLGYVVDMIEVEFIRFPVFNVADCFITCGCILLLVHLLFFNRSFWKDEKK